MNKTFAVSVALLADLFIGFGLGYALRHVGTEGHKPFASERRSAPLAIPTLAVRVRQCLLVAMGGKATGRGHTALALLLQRMQRLGVSRFHPGPVGACEAAERTTAL
jgi:hypothetical protein